MALIDKWLDLRDRILSSARFQRAAIASPFLRPIARARASELFDLCAGFVYSQILFACVEADLFSALAETPRDAAWLAERADLSEAAAERLLRAAAALKLLQERSGGRFGLGPHGAAFLANPGLAAMVRHHAVLYRDLADPIAALRAGNGGLGDYWGYAGADVPRVLNDEAVAAYSRLMAASLPIVADEIFAAFPIKDCAHVLDIAGGEGAFAIMAAQRCAGPRFTVVDLPSVARRAETRIEDAGLGARIKALGGDCRAGPLPEGADLATLIRVLHDHDDNDALRILETARKALAPGARLLVAEPVAGAAGAPRIGDAYFGVYLRVMGSGRPRSVAETSALLRRAGFSRIRPHRLRMPFAAQVITAAVHSI